MRTLESKAIIWQTLANYAERGWGFLYSIILARVILPESFGLYATGLGVVALITLFTKWEVGNIVRVDKDYQTDEGFGKVWAMTRLLAQIEIFLIALVSGIYIYIGELSFGLVILIIGVFTALDKFPNLLRCDLESQLNFSANFKVKLVFTPIAAAITIPMGFMGYGVWALASSAWVGFIVNWFVFKHYNKRVVVRKKANLEELRSIIMPGFWQWVCYISVILYTRVDKLVVSGLGGKASVGYYNRAFNYGPLSFLFLGAVAGNAAIVQFSQIKEEKRLWTLFWKKTRFLVFTGILMGALWLMIGEQLVLLLFGENWLPAVPYFKAFSMFGAVQGIYYLSTSLMQSHSLFKQQGLISLAVIVISTATGYFFVNDALDFIIAVQASMVLASLVMIFKIKYNYKYNIA